MVTNHNDPTLTKGTGMLKAATGDLEWLQIKPVEK
jgi:hypothetical protein